jgi:hypothetical protein
MRNASLAWLQDVTAATYSMEKSWLARIDFYFSTQARHLHIDCALARIIHIQSGRNVLA